MRLDGGAGAGAVRLHLHLHRGARAVRQPQDRLAGVTDPGEPARPGAGRPAPAVGRTQTVGTTIGVPVAGFGITRLGRPKTSSISAASTTSFGAPCATIRPAFIATM